MLKNTILKNFRLNLIFRILLLSLSVFCCTFYYLKNGLDVVSAIIFLIIAYQVFLLISYVDKTNKELIRFLESIKYSDFTQTFSFKHLGNSFESLNNALNNVLEKFKQARNEKEEQSRYLQTMVQHIGIGLISFFQDGEVNLINNAAKKLLRLNSLKNIKQLENINKSLVDELLSIKTGKKALVKFVHNNDFYQLMLFATEFKMHNKVYKFVSIHNIWNELEEKEMEAWQKLISVLTHEIMNSITPISSIAQTLNGMLSEDELSADTMVDIKTGMQTIQKRSEGLISFVNNYRTLSKIPAPNFSIVQVKNLFESISKLMERQICERSINFKINIDPPNLELTIDERMIEQVLINLLLNAIDAVKEKSNASIELRGFLGERGTPVIQVSDNGIGILNDVQDKIFIPFFTTKQGGSGIGLSLAKQIMRQHSGNIRFTSRPEEGTIFSLYFGV